MEELNDNKKLSLSENNELEFISLLIIDDSATWNITQSNNNYVISNKNNCFLKIKKFNIKCENIPLEEAENNELDKALIEKEQIDVLIKYIDLRDPFLKREGIHQIKKDFDNEEIRYSIRSILKNIPWVRKIFILMPNEKVRYLKDYSLIKEKIVYIKDRDLIGFDSSSSLAFQFRYWKMKEFGISDNFIVMDDDYFIGSPLKKTDFFYVENNKVIPALITSNFIKIDEFTVQKNYDSLKLILKESKDAQTSEAFDYSVYLTYLYFLKMFNRPLIIPKYTHNAMPVNLKELKEIYDLIYKSKYKSTTLDSTYRHIDSVQYQTFIFSYTFVKYNKKVRNIPYKYINNKDSIFGDYNACLFCVNTGSIYYSPISFLKTKIVLEYLFPSPTPYEVIYNSFPYLSYNVVYTMENEINELKDKNNKLIESQKKIILSNWFLFLFIIIILFYWKIRTNQLLKFSKKYDKIND